MQNWTTKQPRRRQIYKAHRRQWLALARKYNENVAEFYLTWPEIHGYTIDRHTDKSKWNEWRNRTMPEYTAYIISLQDTISAEQIKEDVLKMIEAYNNNDCEVREGYIRPYGQDTYNDFNRCFKKERHCSKEEKRWRRKVEKNWRRRVQAHIIIPDRSIEMKSCA